ncbi:MAG: hypothetical protein EA383_13850 [Spirochaetaceae bacterium]|nr:MAG: hypothetical protein EA383_13850 [Spirochaetaceae bacterium]
MVRSFLEVLILFCVIVTGVRAQANLVDPVAQREFAAHMGEGLDETALRFQQLRRFSADFRRITVVLDTDLHRINDATLFRQSAYFPNWTMFNYFDFTSYSNGPARPLRFSFGSYSENWTANIDFQDIYTWFVILVQPPPFTVLTAALEQSGVYARNDVYTSIYASNQTIWHVPFTDNFVGNYPQQIRSLRPVWGGTLREVLDDAQYDDGEPPEERSFTTFELRTVEYVDTRFFRASSAFSMPTLQQAYIDALFRNPAERADGEYSRYRWFGDDSFSVFNTLSFELNLAELYRAGSDVARDRLGADRLPVDVFALAERAVTQLEREPESKDVTRYGTVIERVPFIGNLSLFGYLSERNDVEPTVRALEGGGEWRLGPFVVSGNVIAPPEMITGTFDEDALEYGYLGGIDVRTSGLHLRATGERRLEFTEAPFYRAQARLEILPDSGTGFFAQATVTASEPEFETREQRATFGLRLNDLRFDASAVQNVIASEVENTFIRVDFVAAF